MIKYSLLSILFFVTYSVFAIPVSEKCFLGDIESGRLHEVQYALDQNIVISSQALKTAFATFKVKHEALRKWKISSFFGVSAGTFLTTFFSWVAWKDFCTLRDTLYPWIIEVLKRRESKGSETVRHHVAAQLESYGLPREIITKEIFSKINFETDINNLLESDVTYDSRLRPYVGDFPKLEAVDFFVEKNERYLTCRNQVLTGDLFFGADSDDLTRDNDCVAQYNRIAYMNLFPYRFDKVCLPINRLGRSLDTFQVKDFCGALEYLIRPILSSEDESELGDKFDAKRLFGKMFKTPFLLGIGTGLFGCKLYVTYKKLFAEYERALKIVHLLLNQAPDQLIESVIEEYKSIEPLIEY